MILVLGSVGPGGTAFADVGPAYAVNAAWQAKMRLALQTPPMQRDQGPKVSAPSKLRSLATGVRLGIRRLFGGRAAPQPMTSNADPPADAKSVADALSILIHRLGDKPAPQPAVERSPRVSAPSMHSFDALVEKLSARHPLADTTVLGVQHMLGSTGSLARALAQSGVPANDVTFVGKPYSTATEPKVIDELRADGFNVYRGGFGFDGARGATLSPGVTVQVYEGNGESIESVANRTLASLPHDHSPLLVLDDGGKLITYLNEHHPEVLPRVVAVEQTRKGIRALAKLNLKVPVVDVADSWAKLNFEAPAIGRSVGHAIETRVSELAVAKVPVGRHVVVVGGGGVVGGATARYLRDKGFNVEVLEATPEGCAEARKQGFVVTEDKAAALRRADILVSATGTNAVKPADLELMPNGALLFNAASGNDEIVADEATKQRPSLANGGTWSTFRGRSLRTGSSVGPASEDVVIHTHSGKELLLARNGNVVNFDIGNAADPIPPRYIQLTRGLLYLAALQARDLVGKPGIHALDLKEQHELVSAVESELHKTGESLLHPTF